MPGVNSVDAADRVCLTVVPGLCCSGHCVLHVLVTLTAWLGAERFLGCRVGRPRSLSLKQNGYWVACLKRGVVYEKNLLHEQNSDDMQTLKQELPRDVTGLLCITNTAYHLWKAC